MRGVLHVDLLYQTGCGVVTVKNTTRVVSLRLLRRTKVSLRKTRVLCRLLRHDKTRPRSRALSWRRERDSNPRWIAPYRFSRAASSTTPAPLQHIYSTRYVPLLSIYEKESPFHSNYPLQSRALIDRREAVLNRLGAVYSHPESANSSLGSLSSPAPV